MEAVRGLTLWNAHEDGHVVIYARGEMDFATTSFLIQTIRDLMSESVQTCLIHCQEVTFIDSETLKHVLTIRRDLARRGKTLGLCRCSSQVQRILDILGLSEHLVVNCI
ncbi:MAG: STAS domain-containing protein [Armatimonadota bacterium]|nr:STAS domain-containing protein [bacterium]